MLKIWSQSTALSKIVCGKDNDFLYELFSYLRDVSKEMMHSITITNNRLLNKNRYKKVIIVE
jgi:hypothetical protein